MINIEKVSITTLVENSVAGSAYLAEWGLSLYLTLGEGRNILLDTGTGRACVPNALTTNVDLGAVNCICLSHGHSDHTGGLHPVLTHIKECRPEREKVDIYCHPAAVDPQYVRHGDSYDYRGIPYHLEELGRLGACFHTSSQPVWVDEDVLLSGEIPLVTDFEKPSSLCYIKKDQEYVPSPIMDDQALFVRTGLGLVILSGCAHRGIINTILQARELTGEDRIALVVGGTHLVKATREQQEKTADMLLELGVGKIGVCHCTGLESAAYLAGRLGPERFFFNNAGASVTFKGKDIEVRA